MVKKVKKIFFGALSVVFVSLITANIVSARVIDINMSRSYSGNFSGNIVEYHTGNIIPTDDVSGRAGKTLAAYSGNGATISVQVKGVSGGISSRSRSHPNNNGDTVFYTSWTDDPYNDDSAEYAKYTFNGTVIELR